MAKNQVSAASTEEAIANTIAQRRIADNDYMKNFRKTLLAKIKGEPLEMVYGSKAYEPYFGKTYSAMCSLIPVTIRFDGTNQAFPQSIARWLQKKIMDTTESNAVKVDFAEETR